jgi:hypothetical protein
MPEKESSIDQRNTNDDFGFQQQLVINKTLKIPSLLKTASFV